MRARSIVVLVFILILLQSHRADAQLLKILTGIDWDIPSGTLSIGPPELDKLPRVLQNAPQDIMQAMLNPASLRAGAAIRASRAQALATAVSLPPQMIETLRPFFPPHILYKAKYTTAWQSSLLPNMFINVNSSVGAVTLDEVIVFRNAQSVWDPGLLGHELVHVLQYDRMGIDSFAHIYTSNWNELESPAYKIEAYIRMVVGSGLPPAGRSYWSMATQNLTPPHLTQQDLVSAIQQFASANLCVQGDPRFNGNTVRISNICGVPIEVMSFTAINAAGQKYAVPCNGCTIPPNTTRALTNSVPNNIAGINFRFLAQKNNTCLEGSWKETNPQFNWTFRLIGSALIISRDDGFVTGTFTSSGSVWNGWLKWNDGQLWSSVVLTTQSCSRITTNQRWSFLR